MELGKLGIVVFFFSTTELGQERKEDCVDDKEGAEVGIEDKEGGVI